MRSTQHSFRHRFIRFTMPLVMIAAAQGHAAIHTMETPCNPITGDVESQRIASSVVTAWIRTEPGTFRMGATPAPDVMKAGFRAYTGANWDEAPVHTVRITQPFRIAQSAVTMEEFSRFSPDYRARVEARGGQWQPNAPAVLVSWEDATAYCDWLSKKEGRPFRLPTEAEWEFAATKLNAQVEEWCLDWWAPYQAGPETDPLGPEDGMVRVIRGRSAKTRNGMDLVEVGGVVKRVPRKIPARLTDRSGSLPEDRRFEIGFRLVEAALPQGQHRAKEPSAQVYRNVSQKRVAWKPQENPDKPILEGGVEFIQKPADYASLPYWSRHHGPSLSWCDNGDLLAAVFTGPDDGSDQFAILLTRLRCGTTQWDPPARHWIAPDRNVACPYLFHTPSGDIDFFATLSSSKGPQHALVRQISKDHGTTWSAPKIVHEWPTKPASLKTWEGEPRLWAHLPIVTLSDGTWIMPSDVSGGHYCGTVLFESNDNGETWRERTRFGWNAEGFAKKGGQSGWIAGIHAPFVVSADGSFLAFGRTNDIEGHAPMSVSSDGGRTWNHQASPFPPIGSAQRPVLMRLSEGPLLFISFTGLGKEITAKKAGISMMDVNGKVTDGYGTFAALSFDEGKTWKHHKLIPMDPTKNPWDSQASGYLACVQSPDGMIHLVSSSRYFRFNLAWLKTPMPAVK